MFAKVLNPDCVIEVGDRTHIGENVVLGPNCKKVSIGFGCFIGRDVYIDVEELTIGDYTTIHHGGIVHGITTSIGHNCWIGHYTIIDSLGGKTELHNNVGVGAHSQLWSHMKFGDTLAGSRWNSSGSLILEDDVWLVGHSITGPIHAERRSMLMTGGVATRNMVENHIYAGSPATDITEKLGNQFNETTVEQRRERFAELKVEFAAESGVNVDQFVVVESFGAGSDVTEFDLEHRTYRPRRTEDEYRFMKFMLYDRAKFVPVDGN